MEYHRLKQATYHPEWKEIPWGEELAKQSREL